MKSRGRTTAVALLSLLLASMGIYLVLVPVVVSKQYSDRVFAAAQPLEASFRSLGESTELPLLTDSSTPRQVRKDNVDHIALLVKDTQKKIDSLERANDTFRPLPYSYVVGKYRDAEALHAHTQRLIRQSEDALDDYLHLVAYLEVFNEAAESVALELRKFNSVYDLNIYAGQSENLQQVARKVRTEVSPVSGSQHPDDIEALTAATVKALNEAASGFEDLAYGLAIPADDPIYTAARKIEGATRQMDVVRGEMYDKNLQQSRTIKNVQDLTEKLELILAVRRY